jgi:cytosine/adenosine deaminase-related metal-dependent hydrolase
MPAPTLLISGGRVYDHDGDTDAPPVRDILIEAGRITEISAPDEGAERKAALREAGAAIEAAGLLVMPGLVNAHYHSYDVLAKGLFEDMPFDVWALHSQPAYYGPRSKAELRLRTLLGAIDCLRHGVTTVQDMCSLVPTDEATLDTILAAYEEIGLRTVFSIAVRDIAALDIAPFVADDVPAAVRALVEGVPGDPRAQLDFVERQIRRLAPLPSRLSWALSPSGPQRSSRTLLEGVADLARRHRLPVLTHVYETKAQTAKARVMCAEQGGSLVRYMNSCGLLGPGTSLVHGVWLQQEEIEMLAAAGAGLVHNPISNIKLKSGIAPMRRVADAGINIALGCDNCSCGDCQSLFQAMKMLCLLAAVTDPQPTGVRAAQALQAATLGGAQALGLAGKVGALRPGMAADLVLLDLSDIAYVPLNSAARQVVFAEAGRGVHTVIVDGEVLVANRRLTRLDEAALRGEVEEAMAAFRRDYAGVAARGAEAAPYLLDANARVARHDVGLDRYAPF